MLFLFLIFEKIKFEQSGVFGKKIAINKIVKQNLKPYIINYKLLNSIWTNSLVRGSLNSNFDAQTHCILTLCCLLTGVKLEISMNLLLIIFILLVFCSL